MAQSEHLPIYKRAYDLCLHLDQVVRGFPRYQKYSLGADLRAAGRQVVRLFVGADEHGSSLATGIAKQNQSRLRDRRRRPANIGGRCPPRVKRHESV